MRPAQFFSIIGVWGDHMKAGVYDSYWKLVSISSKSSKLGHYKVNILTYDIRRSKK